LQYGLLLFIHFKESLDARKKRSDVSIEPDSYLLVINAHRYNPPKFEPEEGEKNA